MRLSTAFFILVLILICVILWVCTNTNKEEARQALQANSFRSIQLQGYKWFACAKDDWSHTGFTAINVNGQIVEGVVCCGLLFKNCTIRFN